MAGHTDKRWPILTKQIEVGDTVEFDWPHPLLPLKAKGTVQASNGEYIKVLWEASSDDRKPQGSSTAVSVGWLIGSPNWDIYDSNGESYKDFKDYPKSQ